MSILIKGEKMPNCCGHCWLIDSGTDVNGKPEYECVLTEEKRAREELFVKRGKYCPLVEIPPHGRLIDADEVTENSKVFDNNGVPAEFVRKVISLTPTVIDSEDNIQPWKEVFTEK